MIAHPLAIGIIALRFFIINFLGNISNIIISRDLIFVSYGNIELIPLVQIDTHAP